MSELFHDRQHAGRLLADRLMDYADRKDVLVLGLPRGGVPVAFEVAQRLRVPLDIVVVRKIGVPGHEEFAMGAIASGGVRVLNEETIRSLGITEGVIQAAVARELQEIERREAIYRGHRPPPEVRGKVVIIVDDGMATGATMHAAVRAIRAQHPSGLIIAVPTASPDVLQEFVGETDEIFSLLTPEDFHAVGEWYAAFSQTSDSEVIRLLGAPLVSARW